MQQELSSLLQTIQQRQEVQKHFASIQLLHQLLPFYNRSHRYWCSNGLPAGVTATFASNTITISGTPTASGTFNYSIPLTGGCGAVNATGTIIVTANNTVTAANTKTLCINTAITPAITHTTTGATGIGAPTGLPAGVTAPLHPIQLPSAEHRLHQELLTTLFR